MKDKIIFQVFVFSVAVFVFMGISKISAQTTTTFYYTFNSNGNLNETGSMSQSSSPYWWLNSGGLMNIATGTGATVQGSLSSLSKWRLAYAKANPIDTDNGYHPQNIFRLVSKNIDQNVRETLLFKINADQLSLSPNRNSSNGVLLFSRYMDGNNLYYSGVRVDGAAVIKKKKNGIYYTLGYKKILGTGTYNKTSNPNLLPKNVWVGLRSETINNTDGSVSIKLYTDIGNKGVWTLALSVVDNGSTYGGSALTSPGNSGIRTDFMDVEFDNYKLEKL